MAKWMNDAGADAALDYWTDADEMVLCSQEPTTYAEATSTYALADVAMTGGDFTKADAAGGGRQVTVAAKSGITPDANGTGTHVALVQSSGSTLRYVTTCPSQAVDTGIPVDIGSWKITLADPT